MERAKDLLGGEAQAPKELKKWAKPGEFDVVKTIEVVGLELLSSKEVTTPNNETYWLLSDGSKTFYKPYDGNVRRLTFMEDAFIGNRVLDIGFPSFEEDLRGVQKGDRITLQRTKDAGKYKWVWKKV